MKENIKNNIKVEDIAKYFGYSKFHFSREFKKITGASAREYLSALKVQIGIEELTKDNSLLYSQIEAGYLSSGTFSTIFTKSTGLSPKKFQMNFKKLFSFLKLQEENTNENIVSYYNYGNRIVSKNKFTVHILTPEGFKGIIFVGLFDKAMPNRLPIFGKALIKARTAEFSGVSDGTYYLMACAIKKSNNPLYYFHHNNNLRERVLKPIKFPLESNGEYTLKLRERADDDPVITINFAELLSKVLRKKKNSKV